MKLNIILSFSNSMKFMKYTACCDVLLTCIIYLVSRFRYSEDDVVAYIVQILQGLDYLHSRRILHLDIKPDNIIVTYMNVVKIIDFGSAQTFNPLFLKQFFPPIGTLDYMCKTVFLYIYIVSYKSQSFLGKTLYFISL